MKTIAAICTALLAGGALAAMPEASARAADLTGTWDVSGTIQHGNVLFTATPVCTFQQAGAQLTGTCKGPNALGPAVGKVEGANVAWQADVKAYTAVGYTGILSFRGTMGPDGVIRGIMTAAGVPGSGPFTEQRR
jgi:hypothetical protein